MGENAGKKKAAIQWDSKCQQAFDDLKRLCTTMPLLAYMDFTQPFKLHTDVCGSGLGAVLYQTHKDGTDAVIAYACMTLEDWCQAQQVDPTLSLVISRLQDGPLG